MEHTQITETEFLHREYVTWGEDYIDELIELGYTPVLTSIGWRWLAPQLTQATACAMLASSRV